MKHSEANEIRYKAFEVMRQLQRVGQIKHSTEEVRLHVDLIMNLHQQLMTSREYSAANKVMNYCRDLNNARDGEIIKLNFTSEEITYIASCLNLYPNSIRPFISEDADINLLLIQSALRTGAHDEGDYRDSKPWGKIAERLAVLQDTDTLMYLLCEMHESIYSEVFGECLGALAKITTLSEVHQQQLSVILTEQFKRYEEDRLVLKEDYLPVILDTAKRLLSTVDFQHVVDKTPLSKIQKQEYVFKLAYVHQAKFDPDRLVAYALNAFDRGNLKDHSKDALSLITLALIEHPERMAEGFKARHSRELIKSQAETLVGNFATVVKYLQHISKKNPHGIAVEPSPEVMSLAISMVIATAHAHGIKGLEGTLEKYCGLEKDQYISLDAYRPYRRASLEKDMNL
jgi:hypothetical protein